MVCYVVLTDVLNWVIDEGVSIKIKKLIDILWKDPLSEETL